MLDFLQALKQNISGEVTPEAKRRALICAGCPFKEVKSYARIVNAIMLEVDGFVCTECKCPLATKIFAEEPKNICPEWTK